MTYNPFSLAGKTILVTGASSGIGQATAIECSKMGARLIVTGRNEERLAETLANLEGEGHSCIIAELTAQDGIERVVAEAGQVDGVVLCAGTVVTYPFLFATRERLDQIFDINFFSPVELLRLLVKKKNIGHGSSVVFVSSVGGVYAVTPGNSIYGASKNALHAMMRSCALELATRKIRVNSVNPGMVETPLIKIEAFSKEDTAKDLAKYPLGRYGKPNEIANGIIYLLSDASAWVTGASLVIDGGVSL